MLPRFTSRIHWLVFILLETMSAVMLFNAGRYQGSVWLTAANSFVATTTEWEAGLAAYMRLGEVNRSLVAENVALQVNIDSLRSELYRLRRDTAGLTDRMRRPVRGLIVTEAQVVSNSVTRRDNFLTLSRGELDGVRPEMGVVSGLGVVGIVYKTSAHYSIVVSVLNSHSEISCRLRGSDFFGYLRWRGGSTREATLEEVPRHATVRRGDVVETSGFSDVFPPGIFVGRVVSKETSPDGLSYTIRVRLGADPSLVRDVVVFANPRHQELDTLQTRVANLEQKETD